MRVEAPLVGFRPNQKRSFFHLFSRSENPIVTIQKLYKLPNATFATMLGVSVNSYSRAKSGATAKPQSILTALEELGYNAGKLAQHYETWRTHRREHLLQVNEVLR